MSDSVKELEENVAKGEHLYEKKSKDKILKGKWQKEIRNYEYLCDRIENEDFRKRVRYSFEYYIKNADYYKKWGKILSIAGIVFPAIATVLTACDAHNAAIAVFTALSAVISGVFGYLKCSERHEAHRTSAENIKAELIAYATCQGLYKERDDDNPIDRDGILFAQIEGIIQQGYKKISALEKKNKSI